MILYSTSIVFFSLLYRLLRIMLKRQNPLLSYVRERDKVHCKCTMQCTVHFILLIYLMLIMSYLRSLSIKLYLIYACYTNITLYDVASSVRCYPRFSITAVCLGTYYPWIRWSTCISQTYSFLTRHVLSNLVKLFCP